MDISPVGIIVGFFPFPFPPLLLLIFFGPLAKKPRARREPSQKGIVGRRRRRRGIRGQGMPHPPHYQTISGGRGRGGEGPLSVRPFCLREEKKRREEMEGDVSPYKNGEKRDLPQPPPPFPTFSTLVRLTVLLLLLLLFPPLFSSPFPPPPLGSGPREGEEKCRTFVPWSPAGEEENSGREQMKRGLGEKGGKLVVLEGKKSLLSGGGEREKHRMNAKPGAAFRAHAMHGGPCCLVIASKGGNLGLRS